jgi:hypothetical protein
MAFIALFESVDAVMKQSGLEVSCLNDFLGGGHTRQVTIASTDVAIIQDSICFVDGKTSRKDGIDLALVKNVSDEEVLGSLAMNALMIISREVRPKILCTKVDEEVAIPMIIRGNEEEVFVKGNPH